MLNRPPIQRMPGDEPIAWVSFRCDDCRLQRIVKCRDLTAPVDCHLPDGWDAVGRGGTVTRLVCDGCAGSAPS
jgi:hypothetical protein